MGAWSMLVPVAGCFVIGLMTRFGSEKIRAHSIPDGTMEAILIAKRNSGFKFKEIFSRFST
jgi:chloride channel protein, CIC family